MPCPSKSKNPQVWLDAGKLEIQMSPKYQFVTVLKNLTIFKSKMSSYDVLKNNVSDQWHWKTLQRFVGISFIPKTQRCPFCFFTVRCNGNFTNWRFPCSQNDLNTFLKLFLSSCAFATRLFWLYSIVYVHFGRKKVKGSNKFPRRTEHTN